MLVERRLISNSQLTIALRQQKVRSCKIGVALVDLQLVTKYQIDRVLKRQRTLRMLAGTLALTCGTLGNAVAETAGKHYTSSIASQFASPLNTTRSKDMQISASELDELSKLFYFAESTDHLFSVNADFSSKTGIQFSFLNSEKSLFNGPYSYDFDPQISLYSSITKPSRVQFSPKKIGPGLDRASNTIPVTFMLTLRGRCLYENSGNKTTLWSLDSAKKGVQRNAELMFSITKHF